MYINLFIINICVFFFLLINIIIYSFFSYLFIMRQLFFHSGYFFYQFL